MGLPSMTPIIGILDDCDCPEAKMLVVVFGHPAHPRWEYIDPRRRPMGPRSRLTAGFPSWFTPLERFGRTAILAEDGMLQVTSLWAGECTATYSDGQPRRWQGKPLETIDIRPQLAGHVIKAVRPMRAASLIRTEATRQRKPEGEF